MQVYFIRTRALFRGHRTFVGRAIYGHLSLDRQVRHLVQEIAIESSELQLLFATLEYHLRDDRDTVFCMKFRNFFTCQKRKEKKRKIDLITRKAVSSPVVLIVGRSSSSHLALLFSCTRKSRMGPSSFNCGTAQKHCTCDRETIKRLNERCLLIDHALNLR